MFGDRHIWRLNQNKSINTKHWYWRSENGLVVAVLLCSFAMPYLKLNVKRTNYAIHKNDERIRFHHTEKWNIRQFAEQFIYCVCILLYTTSYNEIKPPLCLLWPSRFYATCILRIEIKVHVILNARQLWKCVSSCDCMCVCACAREQ